MKSRKTIALTLLSLPLLISGCASAGGQTSFTIKRQPYQGLPELNAPVLPSPQIIPSSPISQSEAIPPPLFSSPVREEKKAEPTEPVYWRPLEDGEENFFEQGHRAKIKSAQFSQRSRSRSENN